MPTEQLKALQKEINDTLTAKFGELSNWKKQHDETIAKFGAATDEQKNAIASLSQEIASLNNRLTELVQNQHRQPGGPAKAKSVGEQLLAMDQVKQFREGMLKATGSLPIILNAVSSDSGSAGTLVQPDLLPGIIAPGQEIFAARSLIASGTTSSNLIKYIKEKGFTNNAASVPEGTQKPESDITFEDATSPVETLAHLLVANKQILDDASALMSYINARLLYGLAQEEDRQLMVGSGSNGELTGLIPQSTAYDTTLTESGDNMLDIIANAALQVRLAEFAPNGIYMHPKDIHRLRKTKDTIGRYMFADPGSSSIIAPWGLRVVETKNVPQGNFLIGAFNLAAQVFDRQLATVDLSEHDRDNFAKNRITIRVEERLALAVYRPEAIVYGAFPAAAASSGSSGSSGGSSSGSEGGEDNGSEGSEDNG